MYSLVVQRKKQIGNISSWQNCRIVLILLTTGVKTAKKVCGMWPKMVMTSIKSKSSCITFGRHSNRTPSYDNGKII